MAKPKCVLCNSNTFEHQLAKIEGKPFLFVQCKDCGGVVGVLDHENPNDWLKAIYHRLDDLISRSGGGI